MNTAPNFAFWDGVPDFFLRDDRGSAARRIAAESIIAMATPKRRLRVVEVGCGPGFDLFDHFWPHLVSGRMSYLGLDGSKGMVDRVRRGIAEKLGPHGKLMGELEVRVGTFDDLQPSGFDVCYTKATLEHQLDFRPPLRRFVAAAKKLAVVNFYRPPAEKEQRDYNRAIDMHSITWARSDVQEELGSYKLRTQLMTEPPLNELWFIRR